MSKCITATQFQTLCGNFGKDSFIRQVVNIRPSGNLRKNQELVDIMEWLDNNCLQPYYVSKESRMLIDHNKYVVFYFMDEQDKMVFTLCFGELFA